MEEVLHRAGAVLMMVFQLWMCFSVYVIGPIQPMRRSDLSWRALAAAYMAGKIVSSAYWYSRPEIAWAISIAADALLAWLGGRGDDWWKKLWGKLQSQALTAVNAASFNQQVKESCG